MQDAEKRPELKFPQKSKKRSFGGQRAPYNPSDEYTLSFSSPRQAQQRVRDQKMDISIKHQIGDAELKNPSKSSESSHIGARRPSRGEDFSLKTSDPDSDELPKFDFSDIKIPKFDSSEHKAVKPNPKNALRVAQSSSKALKSPHRKRLEFQENPKFEVSRSPYSVKGASRQRGNGIQKHINAENEDEILDYSPTSSIGVNRADRLQSGRSSLIGIEGDTNAVRELRYGEKSSTKAQNHQKSNNPNRAKTPQNQPNQHREGRQESSNEASSSENELLNDFELVSSLGSRSPENEKSYTKLDQTSPSKGILKPRDQNQAKNLKTEKNQKSQKWSKSEAEDHPKRQKEHLEALTTALKRALNDDLVLTMSQSKETQKFVYNRIQELVSTSMAESNEKALKDKQTIIQNLQTEISALKNASKVIKKKLKKAKEENLFVKNKLTESEKNAKIELEKVTGELQAEIEALKQDRAKYEGLVDELNQNASEKNSTFKTLSEKMEGVRRELQAKNEALERLENEKNQFSTKIKNKQNEISELKQELLGAKKAIKKRTKQILNLETEKKKFFESYKKTKNLYLKETENLRTKIKEFETRLSSRENQQEAQEYIKKLESKFEEIKAHNKVMLQRLEENEFMGEHMRSEIDELKQKIEKSEQENCKNLKLLNDSELAKIDLKQALSAEKHKNCTIFAEYEKVKKKVKYFKKEAEGYSEEIKTLKRSLVCLETDHENLKFLLESEKRISMEKIFSLKKQVKKLQKAVHAVHTPPEQPGIAQNGAGSSGSDRNSPSLKSWKKVKEMEQREESYLTEIERLQKKAQFYKMRAVELQNDYTSKIDHFENGKIKSKLYGLAMSLRHLKDLVRLEKGFVRSEIQNFNSNFSKNLKFLEGLKSRVRAPRSPPQHSIKHIETPGILRNQQNGLKTPSRRIRSQLKIGHLETPNSSRKSSHASFLAPRAELGSKKQHMRSYETRNTSNFNSKNGADFSSNQSHLRFSSLHGARNQHFLSRNDDYNEYLINESSSKLEPKEGVEVSDFTPVRVERTQITQKSPQDSNLMALGRSVSRNSRKKVSSFSLIFGKQSPFKSYQEDQGHPPLESSSTNYLMGEPDAHPRSSLKRVEIGGFNDDQRSLEYSSVRRGIPGAPKTGKKSTKRPEKSNKSSSSKRGSRAMGERGAPDISPGLGYGGTSRRIDELRLREMKIRERNFEF